MNLQEVEVWQLWLSSNDTVISGLSAGVRYKLSLYAVASAGVSKPSSRLVYSREQSKTHTHTHTPTMKVTFKNLSVWSYELEPVSGPSVLVLQREPGRILIQWDRLPVDQQRGFITGYNIYLRTLDSSSTEQRGEGPPQLYYSLTHSHTCTTKSKFFIWKIFLKQVTHINKLTVFLSSALLWLTELFLVCEFQAWQRQLKDSSVTTGH